MAILETITVGDDTYDIGSPTTSTGLPIGTIISFMGTIAPLNYLACNGQTVNIADYPDLADFFLAQFGSKDYFGGDGTTTIGIPDLRGEFLRGTGTNSHSNQGSGANVGTHQNATEAPWIYGVVNSDVTKAQIGIRFNSSISGGGTNGFGNSDGSISGSANAKYVTSVQANISTASGAQYRVTMRPTNTSVMYCILAK